VSPEKVVAALLVRRTAQLLAAATVAVVAAVVLFGVGRGIGLTLLAGGAAMAIGARSHRRA
jgi:hypothetical protein